VGDLNSKVTRLVNREPVELKIAGRSIPLPSFNYNHGRSTPYPEPQAIHLEQSLI
jgi:hypothetical protein